MQRVPLTHGITDGIGGGEAEALAPISEASSRMIANSTPTVGPRCFDNPDATAPASVK